MAQHTSSLLPSVDGVLPAPINWMTDMEQGFMVTGRRSVRVPSNIPGPFMPNGQRQIVITTQSMSDELMDTSTLRLKFDYRASYNSTGVPTPATSYAYVSGGPVVYLYSATPVKYAATGSGGAPTPGQGVPAGTFIEPGRSVTTNIPYTISTGSGGTTSSNGGPFIFIQTAGGTGNTTWFYTGPISGYGGSWLSQFGRENQLPNFAGGLLPFYNILDDGGLSWVRSITVSVGNQVMETIDKYNVLSNWLVYNTAKRDWLFSQGVAAGYWLDYMAAFSSQTGAGSAFCNLSYDASGLILNNLTASRGSNSAGLAMITDVPAPARNCAGGMTLVCPLFCLAITRTRKLQAFKYWRGLQITIDLEDWERCHTICDADPNCNQTGYGLVGYPAFLDALVSGSPNPVTVVQSPGYTVASAAASASTASSSSGSTVTYAPSYQISNVFLLYDLVAPSADFAAQLERIALSDGAGMAFKFDAWSTQTTQRTGLIQNSTVTFTNSVSYTKVKSLFALFRDASVTAIPAQPFKTGTFIFPGLINYQWQVGSRRFPDFQTGDSTGWPVATGNTGVSMDSPFGNPSMLYRSGLAETYSYLKDALGEYNDSEAGGVVNLGTYWKQCPFNTISTPIVMQFAGYDASTQSSTGTIPFGGNGPSYGKQFFQYVPARFSIGLNMQVLNDAMLGADLRSTAPNTQLTITLGGDPSSTDQPTIWAAKVLEYILVVWYDMYLTIRGGVVGISK